MFPFDLISLYGNSKAATLETNGLENIIIVK